ncbi:ABC transporter permease [Eudoraea chungangensis]|uniref:ABC transporter permease n=1 Tax=Eudoraea chungangensis TaxID=1481905 RepID=UPI0023EE069F|nr:ABC transporter permease [Eudoraea chungangensis]
MFINHIKIAWRNLLKNKGFTFINIIGLSIGVAACVLISIYIVHERSYDKKIENSENIYRMINRYISDGTINDGIHFSANTAPTVLSDFPEVMQSGRIMDNELFWGAGSNEIRIGGEQRQHHEERFTYADQAIIDIMQIPMVHGVSETALAEPNTVVISERISRKYFGTGNPIGKVIYLNGNNGLPFRINGVMKDFSSNSHMDYDFLITLEGVEFGEGEQTRWTQNNYYTYITLRSDADPKAFEEKMSNHLIEEYIVPANETAGYVIPEDFKNQFFIKLQALTDINLYSSTIDFEASKRNDIKIIWIFGIIALFILVIASINFVNLSTAKSSSRAKEVGVRKVVGSSKRYLIRQFLTESVLITVISFTLGTMLAWVLMPLFRSMSGKELSLPFTNPIFLISLLAGALIVGVLAGLYPSFYLSKFQPAAVLKGDLTSGSKSSSLRSGLVVFQFTISIILIIGTLIVNQQMNFILNSKLGFEKGQVIQLYGTNLMGDQLLTFKEELKNLNGVENVSISDFLPIEGTKRNGNSYVNEGRDNIDETVPGQAWVIDEDYLETLGMTLELGRNFDKDRASDENATIVNQTMVKELLLEDPIGKKISRYGTLYEIIGVVNDFNYNTLQQKVQPLCFFRGISPSITSVKVSSTDLPELIKDIEEKWSTFNPNMEMRYEFMDNSFALMYANVSRIKSIFISFAILAIFVACLGLFALSAFMVEQRKKEISIRLVLGAPFRSIYSLLTLNFLKLVLIAIVMAVPIGWLMMRKWLEDFSYKINISWEVFLIAGIAAIVIALVTISYQSIGAALLKPLKSLRTE